MCLWMAPSMIAIADFVVKNFEDTETLLATLESLSSVIKEHFVLDRT